MSYFPVRLGDRTVTYSTVRFGDMTEPYFSVRLGDRTLPCKTSLEVCDIDALP